MYRHLTALLLAFIMLFSALPLAALAEEDDVPTEEIIEETAETIPETTEALVEEETEAASEEIAAYALEDGIAIDAANFPDDAFRAYLQAQFDLDGDGVFSASEAERVDTIDLRSQDITSVSDVTGIAHFPRLQNLFIDRNQVTFLDLSANPALADLRCSQNKLTSLDVSMLPQLRGLECASNSLTALDLTQNPQLEKLWASSNALTSLDLSQNPLLQLLNIGSNRLTTLDLTHNPELESLGCPLNPLTTLTLNAPKLRYLDCANGQITALDLSGCASLEEVNCEVNQLRSLDLSGCASLEQLTCYQNQLTSLNLSDTNLYQIDCSENQLTTLDPTALPGLQSLQCSLNQITALDVSQNPNLVDLWCMGNKLTALDLTQNPQLVNAFLTNNQLTTLNLSKNPDLVNLYVIGNRLTSLNLSKNTKLRLLYCTGNHLTSLTMNSPLLEELNCVDNELTALDLSRTPNLKTLYCSRNHLTSLDLSVLSASSLYVDFASDDNTYAIKQRTQDLTALPGKFDISKASNWIGGTVKGTTLTAKSGASKITYDYDCGKSCTMTVTLTLPTLSTPKLKAYPKTTSPKPRLTWDPVPGASQYQLYFSPAGTNQFQLLITTSKTTITHTGAIAGRRYDYKVVALSESGEVSPESNIRTVRCYPNNTSIIVRDKRDDGKPSMSWTKVPAAVGYQIRRRVVGSSSWTVYEPNYLSYTHSGAKPGVTYEYQVRALDSARYPGNWSKSVKIVCAPAVPALKVSLNFLGKPALSWNKSTGATGYVTYSRTDDGDFTKLSEKTGTSVTHTKAKSGTTYEYRMRAYIKTSAGKYIYSNYSPIVSIRCN